MRSLTRFLTLLLVASLSLPASAKDKAPEVFAPTSAWLVDYADDFCGLQRDFASGGTSIHLELRQYAPGDSYDLFLWGDWNGLGRTDLQYRFTTSPDSLEKGSSPRVFDLKMKNGQRGILISGNWADLATVTQGATGRTAETATPDNWAASVNYLLVDPHGSSEAALRTGHMDQAKAAMDTCLDELITHWGIDASAHRTLLKPATPRKQGDWARKIQRNYPSSALTQGERGPINIRLKIDRTGKPTECRTIASLAAEVLNSTACEGLMQYGVFDPAIAADGEPIDSYWASKVVYWVG